MHGDVSDDPEHEHQALTRIGANRVLAVPMLRDGAPIGAITVSREKGRPFSDNQIALLQTFAAQAVIAIENVRLFRELEARNRDLTEALEQQMATGEILRVISSSPTDLAPVMDAVTRNATRLARADHALIGEAVEGRIRWLAASGCPLVSDGPPISRELPSGRAILDCQTTQVEDVTELTEDFPGIRRAYDEFQVRTILATPLVREGLAIGVLLVRRTTVRSFTGKEIELLRTFADQAVVAIENVRLFTELGARNRELTEALEQQTATGEILRVISSSPTDLQPTFDAIATSAARLCEAAQGAVFRFDGRLIELAAHYGTPAELAATRQVFPIPPGRGSATGRAILTRDVVHLDITTDPEYEHPELASAGFTSTLSVPMLRKGDPIGVITVSREEGRPFSNNQIALLRTFADQAVIAVENVQLFTELGARNRELTEALEQQTATAEILRVISSSPADLQPVMNAVAESAARFCGADNVVVYRAEGGVLRVMAVRGPLPAVELPINRGVPSGRAVLDRETVHVPDLLTVLDEYPEAAPRIEQTGVRAMLAAPLLRTGEAIGTITIRRDTHGPFTDKQVKLLETFANQAVIAIENVRLFQELQARNRDLTESLEQQTATAEILRVISSSPTDVQPVFDTIVESVVRLCDGVFTTAFQFDGELIRPVAYHRAIGPEGEQVHRRMYPRPPSRDSVVARAIHERTIVHVADVERDPDVPATTRELARAVGYQSILAVPMLRDGNPIGALGIGRRELNGRTRPFSEREIALIRTFADQAVIAIENVRLFQELEARNRELTEALEQQTATGEILRAISGSPTDTQPVFDSIAQAALRLCDGRDSLVFRFDGTLIHIVAQRQTSREVQHEFQRMYPLPLDADTMAARSIRDRAVVHSPDIPGDPANSEFVREMARTGGYRGGVIVPMLRSGSPIGAIGVTRGELNGQPRPFSDKEIVLLETFADQAVIAIENARLFTELEARNRELTESLEQQTATGEILQVISSSPTDTRPVFDAIVRSAGRLGDAAVAMLLRLEGRTLELEALEGMSEVEMETHRRSGPREVAPDSVAGRVILTRRIVRITDVKEDPEYAVVGPLTLGYRTALGVPLLREGAAIGAIVLWRREVRPFADKQIQLVRTFADQAVIAIENVRLFTELGARNRELTESLEQQTATSEILRAISASPTDTQPVFDTIAQHAFRVCDGSHCTVFRFDGTLIHMVAHHGQSPGALEVFQQTYPLPPDADTMAARSIREGAVVHNPDMLSDPAEAIRRISRVGGYRTGVVVPMLRSGRAIGAIGVGRSGPGGVARPYTEKEIALLQTFADQGVIAVENVRLFRELEMRTRELARSVEELQALSEVGRAVSSTLDLPTVLATIVARAVQLSGTSGGVIYEYDEAAQEFFLRASHRTEDEFLEVLRATPIRLGEGASGQAALRREPVEIADMRDDRQYQVARVRSVSTRLGYRSVLGIPLLLERRILGALTVWRREAGSFPPETVKLLQTFATQSALAIQNARLFREIEAKGQELEVASRHKSQFLANMSHELRTPLNAVLGYTELLIDGIYGELSPKAGDVMTRIDRSGKHLLGLINDVLDLSKIEAGQLELALADYALGEVVHTVVTQVESLAAEKGLILQAAVTPDLPAGRGDERRLAQVLLNLVGNAIKFTEVGSVRIAAHRDGDAFVVSVADSGPGIAEVDRQRIFEEFQQADSSSTRKKGGTGLGLSIARRIVELHGGRLWVESTVGRGSVFSFRVPVRVDRQAARA